MSSEEFRVIWCRVKETATQTLSTEETMIADRTTGEKVPTPDSPPRKRKSSKISKAVAVDYPGDLEKHRDIGNAMFHKAVIAMENIDTADGAAVKEKMTEIRKSSRRSAKGLTPENFKELWHVVKNAVADECGFRYAKPAGISAGSKDGAAAQADASAGPVHAFGEQQHQSSLPPPSGDDSHGQLVEASSAGKSSTCKGKETGNTDRRTEKTPEPQLVVAARNDTQENQGAQGGMRSKVNGVETAEASNDTREKEGAQGMRSRATEVKMAEVSNAPKKRRLGGVSESKLPDYGIHQKEQWYHEMVAGIHEAIMKPNAPSALESILAEHKKRWMKQLGIPNSEFRAIWERVIQRSKSFKATKDWSFLVVGKNYNPDGIDFKTWDTYEELASDPEE
jgi:hypothetical protein